MTDRSVCSVAEIFISDQLCVPYVRRGSKACSSTILGMRSRSPTVFNDRTVDDPPLLFRTRKRFSLSQMAERKCSAGVKSDGDDDDDSPSVYGGLRTRPMAIALIFDGQHSLQKIAVGTKDGSGGFCQFYTFMPNGSLVVRLVRYDKRIMRATGTRYACHER